MQETRATRDSAEGPARLELPVIGDPTGSKERSASPASTACVETGASRVQPVSRATRAHRAVRARSAVQALRATKDHRDRRELPAIRAVQAAMDSQVRHDIELFTSD